MYIVPNNELKIKDKYLPTWFIVIKNQFSNRPTS